MNDKERQKIENLLYEAEKNIKRAREVFEAAFMGGQSRGDVREPAGSRDYSKVLGVEGIYDGFYMVTDAGEKFEVPVNYAAKTKLVYGDRLKLVEEDGKKLFKHINKVARKQVSGVLIRKDNGWCILTDTGCYKVLDNAVEFAKGSVHDDAVGVLPEGDADVPFAALERVVARKNEVEVSDAPAPPQPINTVATNSVKPEAASAVTEIAPVKPAVAPKEEPPLSKPPRSSGDDDLR